MKIAIAQINSTEDVQSNLEKISTFTRKAAESSARAVVFPEAAMSAFGSDLLEAVETYGEEWRRQLSRLAAENNIFVIAGEFEAGTDGLVRNLAGLYAPDGNRSHYAKIHLYDAFGYRESESVEPGGSIHTSDLCDTKVGVAICYDIRFPKLFAELSRSGAEVIFVVASWGAGPGKVEQWKTLAQARALDSNAFVVAVDQADPSITGAAVDPNSPTGVGHSVISDPFGRIIAELGKDEQLKIVDLDLTTVSEAKKAIPVLANAKLGY